jgi:lipoprotein-releasing system permease protein
LYKLLLCWRYLLTRYLALVCIVSVMLGVATLIVVNSVMAGFSTKLRDRLHGLLSDVVIESENYNGFDNYDGLMAAVRADDYLSQHVEAMTPTLEVFAMIQFDWRGQQFLRPVRVIGIDPEGRAKVGGFGEHLLLAPDRTRPNFELGKDGFGRYLERHPQHGIVPEKPKPQLVAPGEPPPPAEPEWSWRNRPDPLPERVIVGYAIAHFRDPDSTPENPLPDVPTLKPGDELVINTVSGTQFNLVSQRFVVSDYIKTEMSEYDSNYVFVSLDVLQQMRTMHGRATSIQIRLKQYKDAPEVVRRLKELVKNMPVTTSLGGSGGNGGLIVTQRGLPVQVLTWEEKQGPLLSAIAIEKGLLNVLLFMIILVAGFGILAIFSMIVVEKTRDIGILKALGASNGGVMKIFLSYGLLLGTVGAAFGTTLGLTITTYINEIEHFLTRVTGQEIFNRSTYYFDKIPTDIQPWSVILVNVGAVGIAVLFSVMPALRAAMLHPVRALRYE